MTPVSEPDAPDGGRFDGPPAGLLPAVFALIAILAGWDVWSDLAEGAGRGHVAGEVAIVIAGLAGFVVTLRRLVRARRRVDVLEAQAAQLGRALAATRAEAAAWKAEAATHIEGLGLAIDRQFDRWELSAAEREVALLLMKGLSMKELADVRGVAEATVRQQAKAVYRKGGLSGRHDLSAFFLEDLLAPPARDGGTRATGVNPHTGA